MSQTNQIASQFQCICWRRRRRKQMCRSRQISKCRPYYQTFFDNSDAENDDVTQQAADSTVDTDNNTTTNEIESNENEGNEMQLSAAVDDFSGSIPFVVNGADDRYYEDYDVGLRAAIVGCLSAWNKSRPFSSVIYDKRFIGVLLKDVFQDELALNDLNEKKMVFIKRVFEIRVDGDVGRASKFDSIVDEKHTNAKSRGRANSIDDE